MVLQSRAHGPAQRLINTGSVNACYFYRLAGEEQFPLSEVSKAQKFKTELLSSPRVPVVHSLETIESWAVEYLLFSKKLFFTLLKMISACRFGNERLVMVSKGM